VHRDLASSALIALLGVWLAATSLLWQHEAASLYSGLVVAALAIAIGVGARRRPGLFWVDLALAAWLVATIWIFPHRPFAGWNQAMVALGLALVPITMRLFPELPYDDRQAEA
jgi:hypothetical protein